jgi:hypothetical protein
MMKSAACAASADTPTPIKITYSEEIIASHQIKLTVQLTPDEASILRRAIDDYFSSHGITDTAAADLIEQMHSKISDALIEGGYDCDDSEG